MSTKNTLREDMKTAMKAGDKDRLGVIRMVMAAIKQVEVDTREELDESAVLAVVEKQVKQRKESAKQYYDAKRPELAEKEEAEIKVLADYLPEQLSDSELSLLIDQIIATTGATGIKDMGKVMAQLKAKAQGRVDMTAAGALVRSKIT